MDNETELTGEITTGPTKIPEIVPDSSTQTKPKSKKGLLIGVVAVAVVAILIIAYLLIPATTVEGKWVWDKVESYNPDGSLNMTVPSAGSEYWEFMSNGTMINGNNSGPYVYSDGNNIDMTWESVNSTAISVNYVIDFCIPDQVTDPDTNETYWINRTGTEESSQIYDYEIDGDTLILRNTIPSGITIVTYFTKVDS